MDSTVGIAGDMADIIAGNFTSSGEDITVNGRTYGMYSDTGTTFPNSGPGIHPLSQSQHQYVKKLNALGLEGARKFGQNLPGLSEADMLHMEKMWKTCK